MGIKFVATNVVAIVLSTLASASAADKLTLADVTALAGKRVEVPVYLRDVSGTLLGVDQPVLRIQIIGFTINFSNTSKIVGCAIPLKPVCDVSFQPSGVLEGKSPVSSVVLKGSDYFATALRYADTPESQINYKLNRPVPGDRIGTLSVNIDPDAKQGDRINLAFDRSATLTFLADQPFGASQAFAETFGSQLDLQDGSIVVTQCDCQATAPSSAVLEKAVKFAVTTTTCGAGTVLWDFGDGSLQSSAVLGATHTYKSSDLFTWSLFILNSDGGSCRRQGEIEVRGPRRRAVKP